MLCTSSEDWRWNASDSHTTVWDRGRLIWVDVAVVWHSNEAVVAGRCLGQERSWPHLCPLFGVCSRLRPALDLMTARR